MISSYQENTENKELVDKHIETRNELELQK